MLGVAGGIAAYKSVTLLRALREAGHQVRVIPTAAALEFVGAPTWAALSGQPVHTSVWDDVVGVEHVRLGQDADLILVAPATADLISRAAAGRADDLLAATLLAARGPVVLAPAMHTEMWVHPATMANVATLRARGVTVVEPAVGRLTGSDSGAGRLPEPESLAEFAEAVLQARGSRDLVGLRVLISAGGTREPIDPVRFIGNRSSGRQGYALAVCAAARGAEVTLVSANVSLQPPAGGVRVVSVGTARELQSAVEAAATEADVVVMAAAVADFRPAQQVEEKIKKQGVDDQRSLQLVANPDVLAGLVEKRRGGELPATTILVGFAAETGDAGGSAMVHAQAKFVRKGVDLLILNDVSGGAIFGGTNTTVHLLGPSDEVTGPCSGSKLAVAQLIWDRILLALPADPR